MQYFTEVSGNSGSPSPSNAPLNSIDVLVAEDEDGFESDGGGLEIELWITGLLCLGDLGGNMLDGM